jgi:hypothetical protein
MANKTVCSVLRGQNVTDKQKSLLNFWSYRPASLCSHAGRYDNPVPNHFLAAIDCSKIPALYTNFTKKKDD